MADKVELGLDSALMNLVKAAARKDRTEEVKKLKEDLKGLRAELAALRKEHAKCKKAKRLAESIKEEREKVKRWARAVAKEAQTVLSEVERVRKMQLGSMIWRRDWRDGERLRAAKRRLLERFDDQSKTTLPVPSSVQG